MWRFLFLRKLPQIGREPTVTRNAVIIVNVIHIMGISFIEDLYWGGGWTDDEEFAVTGMGLEGHLEDGVVGGEITGAKCARDESDVTHAFGHHHIDGNVGVCNVCFHGERGIPTPSPSPREGRPSGEGGKIRKIKKYGGARGKRIDT